MYGIHTIQYVEISCFYYLYRINNYMCILIMQFSFPLRRKIGGEVGAYEVVKDYVIDGATQELLNLTIEELQYEREAAKSYFE